MTPAEIRQAREARGMTQAQLADALGVGVRTINSWEAGAHSPRNRMAMLEQFFAVPNGAAPNSLLADVPESVLLAELVRRAIMRGEEQGE